jgi:hypothetical protein
VLFCRVSWTTSELKESLLIVLALFWGLVLILPGNTFFPQNRVDYLGLYAEDWVWGSVLLVFSFPLLVVNRYKNRFLRRLAHAFYWVFWNGIALIIVLRSMSNGLNEVDFLLCSPFVTIAFMHGIIYAGLWRQV